MKEIEIVVEPDGTLRVKTHGLLGAECLEATEAFARLGHVRQDERTREFHQARTGAATVRTRRGS